MQEDPSHPFGMTPAESFNSMPLPKNGNDHPQGVTRSAMCFRQEFELHQQVALRYDLPENDKLLRLILRNYSGHF